MEKSKIILGATELVVVPITLGLMKRMGMGAAKQALLGDIIEREQNWYEGGLEVLSASTGKTIAELEAIEDVTRDQLVDALNIVYRKSGIITDKKDGDAKGEETGS